jgi:hypothetical protein
VVFVQFLITTLEKAEAVRRQVPNTTNIGHADDDVHIGPVEAEPPSSRALSTTTYKPDIRESEIDAEKEDFWYGVFN